MIIVVADLNVRTESGRVLGQVLRLTQDARNSIGVLREELRILGYFGLAGFRRVNIFTPKYQRLGFLCPVED